MTSPGGEGATSACDSNYHKERAKTAHLRPMRAVAAVVDGRRDAHHGGREEVPGDVVVLPARELALEHLDQHEVELHALEAHPGERRQEAEVENARDDGAHQLTGTRGYTQTMSVLVLGSLEPKSYPPGNREVR